MKCILFATLVAGTLAFGGVLLLLSRIYDSESNWRDALPVETV
jgi:hypothetical protein